MSCASPVASYWSYSLNNFMPSRLGQVIHDYGSVRQNNNLTGGTTSEPPTAPPQAPEKKKFCFFFKKEPLPSLC
jgi:hypothetical protein